jgi:hypothetical protein
MAMLMLLHRLGIDGATAVLFEFDVLNLGKGDRRRKS